MKLISLLFILLSFTLNCIAIDVILNPYDSIDYDSVNSYPKNECYCNCDNYEENNFNQVNKNWWE